MTFRRGDALLRLCDGFPEIDFRVVWSAEEMAQALPGSELLILNNRICTLELGAVVRDKGRDLRWIQFLSSGLEMGHAMGLPEGIPVTNAAGVKAPVIAEHAMTILLTLARRVVDIVEGQRRREWIRFEVHPLMTGAEGKTLVVVGMGAIGREVARKAKAFDMRVVGVSRAGKAEGDFDAVLPRTGLRAALAHADAVVLCLPSDAETRHLIGAAELAAMKPTAFLVNVARGEIVDQDALTEALRDGRIAGAALDVTDPEPLPPENSLWTLTNVLISPHVSGGGSTGLVRFSTLFAENLRRYEAGLPLQNVVAGPATPPRRR
jgi:phosphoglycerate dehydrogenase-like enzyme